MVVQRKEVVTKKSARRSMIVDGIIELLKSDVVYKTIDYRHRKEAWIKQYMHQPFIAKLKEIHRRLDPKVTEKTLEKRARASLLWEGDVTTTINNFLFLGVQHRPDFIVHIDGLRIAVEVKRGATGAAVREGLGQSLVYASEFDFVCYIFVDVSKDKKVKRGFGGDAEQFFVERLWNDFNVRIDVV
jgi:hypothetical protein